MNTQIEVLKNHLEDRTIQQIIPLTESEEGQVLLILDNGATLQFGWADCKLNGRDIQGETQNKHQ